GSYRGDNGLAYFDLNDFDEGALGPATWELARFLTSVLLAADSLGLSAEQSTALSRGFLTAYADALADGKARWVERATSIGMVRDLLGSVKRRSRAALLDARTVSDGTRRMLRIDGRRTLALPKGTRADVVECLERFAASQPDPRQFKVIDVARRVAGTGSLGVMRFVVLVRGSGAPNGYLLLDLKEARPSALAPYVDVAQPAWADEADRVLRIQRRMQAISPALLQAVSLEGRRFILKELQPTADRLALEHWNGRLGRLQRVMTTMGHLVAWAQLRSGSRDGSGGADSLIAFARTKGWRTDLVRYARQYRRTVQRDWRRFAAAFEAGSLGVSPPAAANKESVRRRK
ncbi:MAG: DUF2252 domain-containing protein, partial [Gemmatimonadota bacterium]|nr:DUF2252 domain-containing protein [Gemmatimonadota bacterium]